jgi:hypothetical protein
MSSLRKQLAQLTFIAVSSALTMALTVQTVFAGYRVP